MEFFETICDRACVFFHQAYRFSAKTGATRSDEPLESAELAVRVRSILRKIMRIPQMEDGLFPEQIDAAEEMWAAEARRVLPSRSPRIDSTAVWAPVLGWALLRVLAEWIEAGDAPEALPATTAAVSAEMIEKIDRRAIALFDQLRLRTAFGEAFAFIGVEGEDAWRAAARIRVAFLPATASRRSVKHDQDNGWWSDADVRWLTGLHETAEGWFFNQESHEQMVWWSALPELVKIESDPAAEKLRLRKLEEEIAAELLAAERAHYALSGKSVAEASGSSNAPGSVDSPEVQRSKKSLDPEIATAEDEAVVISAEPAATAKK
jgi:hypothetical protein